MSWLQGLLVIQVSLAVNACAKDTCITNNPYEQKSLKKVIFFSLLPIVS